MLKWSNTIAAGLAALAALLGSCASEQETPATVAVAFQLPPGAETAAEAIQAETLSGIVGHLADDTLRGRGPSTEGDRLARRYISGFLQEVGFDPGGVEGSWEQPFELVGISSEMPKIWSFDSPEARLDLDWWDDFVGTSGVQQDVVGGGLFRVRYGRGVGYSMPGPGKQAPRIPELLPAPGDESMPL